MNKILVPAFALALVGFLWVASTGVDLVSSRIGGGLVALGFGALLMAIVRLIRPGELGKGGLLLATFGGGFYFIWRALSGEAIGLAIPDVVLVVTFLTTYFVVSVSGSVIRKFLMIGVALLCVVNVGVALFQEFGETPFYVWKAVTDRVGTTSGLFGHYNPFAGFLNGSLFFLLSYLLLGKKVAPRIGCGVLVVGMLFVLVLSDSRGGWVSFVGGAVIWLVLLLAYLKQQNSQFFGVALVIGVMMGVVGLTSSFWMVQKITEGRAELASEHRGVEVEAIVSDGGRFAYQQLAFEIFQKSPVIGMGARSYSYLSLEKWDPKALSMFENPPTFAHNEFLQSLSDYGIIGFLIIIILISVHGIMGVYGAVTDSGADKELSIWRIGAIGGLAAILCQCFFSFLLHTPSCMVLVAVQVGILGSFSSKSSVSEPSSASITLGRFSAAVGLAVSICALALGLMLGQSYFLSQKANQQLRSVTDDESVFRALATMSEAGEVGRDPEIFENVGRLAIRYANGANEAGDFKVAEKFNSEAKRAFENALKYNPHFAAAIAGLPMVEDTLGNWEVANVAHQRAMERLWSREYRLRPYYNAAVSSYRAGLRALERDERGLAMLFFEEGRQRLQRRREILYEVRELADEKSLRKDFEAWSAYLEGQLLFQEGDRVWKNVRPRNPELAYALMLEAKTRYQASEAVVRDQNANWEKQVKLLEINLSYLKSGQVRPAKLSEEELKVILKPEPSLDSLPVTR